MKNTCENGVKNDTFHRADFSSYRSKLELIFPPANRILVYIYIYTHTYTYTYTEWIGSVVPLSRVVVSAAFELQIKPGNVCMLSPQQQRHLLLRGTHSRRAVCTHREAGRGMGKGGGGGGGGGRTPREEMERNRLKSQIKTNKNRRAGGEIEGAGRRRCFLAGEH